MSWYSCSVCNEANTWESPPSCSLSSRTSFSLAIRSFFRFNSSMSVCKMTRASINCFPWSSNISFSSSRSLCKSSSLLRRRSTSCRRRAFSANAASSSCRPCTSRCWRSIPEGAGAGAGAGACDAAATAAKGLGGLASVAAAEDIVAKGDGRSTPLGLELGDEVGAAKASCCVTLFAKRGEVPRLSGEPPGAGWFWYVCLPNAGPIDCEAIPPLAASLRYDNDTGRMPPS
mmetsp:Transcript_83553/g.190596  ORF Transcript_83553/g.190596 Transcript_83553/m.190596 type:complete len:230 (+) Transcript_83553:613-1302(+)